MVITKSLVFLDELGAIHLMFYSTLTSAKPRPLSALTKTYIQHIPTSTLGPPFSGAIKIIFLKHNFRLVLHKLFLFLFEMESHYISNSGLELTLYLRLV